MMGAYCKRGNRNRQVEAPRSSAAGIDKESPAQFFDYRLVRMAGDDSRESRGSWIELELRQVMKDVDCVAANLDHIVCGKTATPSARVVIATHGSDRRNGSERVQNRWVADVAAMNDEVRVVERIERLRPNQTVGICYQAYAMQRSRHAPKDLRILQVPSTVGFWTSS